ncbi:tetratricopeptide repeat protein [Variovorax sp. N23]|uniref:tetratricopeptide repeat protein n=1 Tax=Variovorax sp. N23 TaxID=2980555 RepID=UPI0021C5AECC|nr:tetratricopeptide repeat protein [Variovorax sp. N23]MCU4121194.1 tetratricopeptide repeat protein [Variovorax sp. N23]
MAQTTPNLPTERQIDDAFRQVLETPSDMGRGMNYAQLLVQAGNYEGGVAALERLLLDPNAPATVRLELAVLYYRLGSYGMAESLLNTALEDARLQGEQRHLAETLLRDTRKRNQISRVDGQMILGLRAQTNPASRTSESQVLAAGTLVPVDPAYRPKSDTDVQLTLQLNHEYDLETQNQATVVSSLVAQVVKFSSSSGSRLQPNQVAPYNLALAEVTSGVRFKPVQDASSGLTLRPHVIAATLSAQGKNLLTAGGLGLDVNNRFSERLLLEAGIEHRQFSYANRIDVPDADALGGPDNLLRARLSRELDPGRVLSGELRARTHRTDRAFYDYDAYEARVTYSATYANPLPQMTGAWTTWFWGSVQSRGYGAPDPAVDPLKKRQDTDWRVGVGNTVPLSDKWSLLMQLEHTRTRSNLPNHRWKNTALLLAVSYRL